MFRIHWKGCPHRHLPRIRLPSFRSSRTRSRLAQEASESVNLLPFSKPLLKAREQERIRNRRRRTRTRSRSGGTTVSIKALRNIEVFGWDSPRYLDSLGVENQETSKLPDIFGSEKKYRVIEGIDRVRHGLVEYSGNRSLPRMDGAGSSKPPNSLKENIIPQERRFTPAYWNKQRTGSGQDTLQTQLIHREDTFGQNRISGLFLPHVSTTDPTKSAPTRTAPTPLIRTGQRYTRPPFRIPIRRVPIKGVPITNAPSRSRTYDPRIPIKKAPTKEVPQRVTKHSPAKVLRSPVLSRRLSIASQAISRSSKRRGWTSPEFRTALSSVINQQAKPSAAAKVSVSDTDLTEPSRTSSERRAVERFTAELANSLAYPKTLGRSKESTVPSIHTVQGFQPYAPEFRAAGLSVTYQDQISNAPQYRTPVKRKVDDLAPNLKTFSFERKRTGMMDGQRDTPGKPAFESATDYTSSSGSTWTAGHHHLRRKKVGPPLVLPIPPSQPPVVPPRPAERRRTTIKIVDPRMVAKAKPKAAPVNQSPSGYTSSSASMSWTAGHHHVRAAKMNAQQGPRPEAKPAPKPAAAPVIPKEKYTEMTPTPAPRRVPTMYPYAAAPSQPPSQPPPQPPVQSARKSIPWLQPVQTGQWSPKGKSVVNDHSSWQDQNIVSPENITTDSSTGTVIDWSPIQDPRANLAVFPLVARPTEVEWVEMNYEHGRTSTEEPTVRVVDMKKEPAWEHSTVDVMPVEEAPTSRRNTAAVAKRDPVEGPFRASPVLLDRSRPFDVGNELSAMVVPVNVISITPVSSVYSYKTARSKISDKPLLCVRCGRLLASPPPKLPSPIVHFHDCTRTSSLCDRCAPSKVAVPATPRRPFGLAEPEFPSSPKRPMAPVEPPSPTGSPPPPIVPIRSLRRTGTLFKKPILEPSPSTDTYGSQATFEGFSETIVARQPDEDWWRPPNRVVEVSENIQEEPRSNNLAPPPNIERNDPASNPAVVANTDFPPTIKQRTNTPKRVSPASAVGSHRASFDTIADIISYYSPAARRSETTASTTSPINPKSIRDKDIFHGLQVVSLAACDERVDTWIKDMSGKGVRQFLADVSGYEKMGIDELSRLARRTARRRRRDVKKAVREREAAEKKRHQNDGVGEGSSDGSSTVKAWKGGGDGKGKGVVTRGLHERRQELDGVAEDEYCQCGSAGMVDKGKGKEKEKDGVEVGVHSKDCGIGRSRRDRFGFRDGHFH